MSPENPEKRRFTLNLPSPAIEELERVRDEGGHGALAEVVREAVAVYLSLHEGRRNGLELYFRDEKNDRSGPIWLLPGPPPATELGRFRYPQALESMRERFNQNGRHHRP